MHLHPLKALSAIICIATAIGVEADLIVTVIVREVFIILCAENAFLALRADVADELFSLGGSKVGHCVLD
jgi:hypothetical protein